MVKFQATAIIRSISGIIDVPSKTGGQGFQKRELVIDDSWEKDGKQYPNFIIIEFSGDKMQQLDNFWQGQKVTVDCILSGREYNGKYFNTVRGQSITLVMQPTQYAAPAPMPSSYQPAQLPQGYPHQQMHQGYPANQPTPAYPQQPYAQTYVPPTAPTGASPQQQQAPTPYGQYSGPRAVDLPFDH